MSVDTAREGLSLGTGVLQAPGTPEIAYENGNEYNIGLNFKPIDQLTDSVFNATQKIFERTRDALADQAVGNAQEQLNMLEKDFQNLKGMDAIQGYPKHNEKINQILRDQAKSIDDETVRNRFILAADRLRTQYRVSGFNVYQQEVTRFGDEVFTNKVSANADYMIRSVNNPAELATAMQTNEKYWLEWCDRHGVDPNSETAKNAKMTTFGAGYLGLVNRMIDEQQYGRAEQLLSGFRNFIPADKISEIRGKLLVQRQEAAIRAQTLANARAAAQQQAYLTSLQAENLKVKTQAENEDRARKNQAAIDENWRKFYAGDVVTTLKLLASPDAFNIGLSAAEEKLNQEDPNLNDHQKRMNYLLNDPQGKELVQQSAREFYFKKRSDALVAAGKGEWAIQLNAYDGLRIQYASAFDALRNDGNSNGIISLEQKINQDDQLIDDYLKQAQKEITPENRQKFRTALISQLRTETDHIQSQKDPDRFNAAKREALELIALPPAQLAERYSTQAALEHDLNISGVDPQRRAEIVDRWNLKSQPIAVQNRVKANEDLIRNAVLSIMPSDQRQAFAAGKGQGGKDIDAYTHASDVYNIIYDAFSRAAQQKIKEQSKDNPAVLFSPKDINDLKLTVASEPAVQRQISAADTYHDAWGDVAEKIEKGQSPIPAELKDEAKDIFYESYDKDGVALSEQEIANRLMTEREKRHAQEQEKRIPHLPENLTRGSEPSVTINGLKNSDPDFYKQFGDLSSMQPDEVSAFKGFLNAQIKMYSPREQNVVIDRINSMSKKERYAELVKISEGKSDLNNLEKGWLIRSLLGTDLAAAEKDFNLSQLEQIRDKQQRQPLSPLTPSVVLSFLK